MKEKINNTKNWIKNNKRKTFIALGIILVLLIIIFLVISNSSKFLVSSSEGNMFKDEYERLNDKETEDGKTYPEVHIQGSDIIKYASLDDVLKILDNGNGVIYFGSAECLYCRNAVQVLMDTAKDTELKDLYYLDITKYWDEKELDENGKVTTIKEASDGYNELLEKFEGKYFLIDYVLTKEDGEKVDLNEKRIEMPLVIFVVNGEVVSSNAGTLFSQYDPYTPLDESQVKGLSEIYSYGIRDVLEGIKYQTNS